MTAEQWHDLGTELEPVGRVVPTAARLAGDACVDVSRVLLAVMMLVHDRNRVGLMRLAEHAVRLSP